MWHKENHSNTKSYAKAAHFAGAFAAHECGFWKAFPASSGLIGCQDSMHQSMH
jgi:hypothetical protein